MFEGHIVPLLHARWAGRRRVEIRVLTNVADESLLNPIFVRVMASVPDSYLKADPIGFGPDVKLPVYIAGEGENEEAAASIAQQAKQQLGERLMALGYAFVPPS